MRVVAQRKSGLIPLKSIINYVLGHYPTR